MPGYIHVEQTILIILTMARLILERPHVMNKMNEQIKQKQTNRYKEWTDGHQRGGGMGRLGEKGEGIKKYKLVVIK